MGSNRQAWLNLLITNNFDVDAATVASEVMLMMMIRYHIQNLGWNFIRLGVVWAGAQPRDEVMLTMNQNRVDDDG